MGKDTWRSGVSARGRSETQTARYSIKLSKQSFSDALVAFGLTSAMQTITADMPVTIVFNNMLYQAHTSLAYKSSNG